MKLRIGENIKSLRKARDITQEALAEMLGVSCQSVSRWELGTCYPDMELLPAIAEAGERGDLEKISRTTGAVTGSGIISCFTPCFFLYP